jgi:GT2 family glycosyltransferase
MTKPFTYRWGVDRPEILPPPDGTPSVRFVLGETEIGTVRIRPPAGQYGGRFLRDLFLDKYNVPLIRQLLEARPEFQLQVEPVRPASELDGLEFLTRQRIGLADGYSWHKLEEETLPRMFKAVSPRTLARLALEAHCRRNHRRDSGVGGLPGAPCPAVSLVLWEERGESENSHPQVAGFHQVIRLRCGRGLPAVPEVIETSDGCRIRARKFDFGELLSLLTQLAGPEALVFIMGSIESTCFLEGEGYRRSLERSDADVLFPAMGWSFRPGLRSALFRVLRQRDPDAVPDGFISPADVMLRRRPLADFAASATAAVCVRGPALLRHAPPFHRKIDSRTGLIHALEEFLTQAAMEGAGFFRDSTIRVPFVGRTPPGVVAGTCRSACRRIRTARRDGWMFVWWALRTLRARLRLMGRALHRLDALALAEEALAFCGFAWGGFWPVSRKPYRPLWRDPGPSIQEIDLELADGGRILQRRGAADAAFAWVTLHLDGAVCGSVGFRLHRPDLPTSLLVRQAWEEFTRLYSKRFLRQLAREWYDGMGETVRNRADSAKVEPVRSAPILELVLATRDRPEDLERLLASLRKVTVPVALHVIDSAPRDASTRQLCDREGIRYSLSPHPGKSRALNLGIRSSSADILLFTDDDARVDPAWPERLLDGFYHPGVAAVTGLVLPMAVRTTAEYLFEMHMDEYEMGGLRRGHVEREFALPYSPFRAAKVGTGVNMAIQRTAFERIGLFEEALSPGTPARAGEEIDLYYRLLRAGFAIVYNPQAVVWHAHRQSLDKLDQLLYSYGVSSGAFATRWLWSERAPAAYYYLWRWNLFGLCRHAWEFRRFYPARLLLREARGALAGPFQYLRSIRDQRAYDRAAGDHANA